MKAKRKKITKQMQESFWRNEILPKLKLVEDNNQGYAIFGKTFEWKLLEFNYKVLSPYKQISELLSFYINGDEFAKDNCHIRIHRYPKGGTILSIYYTDKNNKIVGDRSFLLNKNEITQFEPLGEVE